MEDVKVTRKLLEDYRRMKREIPLLEEELERMRGGEYGLASSVILDYRKGYPQPQGIVGFDGARYDRRLLELETRKAECRAVEEWIRDIPDGRARHVFRMFYIDGMKWEKIAAKTGYAGNPDYPRLMIRDRYLKERKMM